MEKLGRNNGIARSSVEKINEDDISNHVTRKTTLLSKISGLRLNAVEELRLRTYSARQKVIAANVQEKNKNKAPRIMPTLSEFWKVEIAVQQAEVKRLQKLCKSTVEQHHPLLELARGTLGLTKSGSMEATKRGGKKKKPRSFEWLLKLIDGIYNARIEYCSKRTSGNMIDSCVQPFPAFVLSYLMEKDSNNKLVARAIENLVLCKLLLQYS